MGDFTFTLYHRLKLAGLNTNTTTQNLYNAVTYFNVASKIINATIELNT